MKLARVDLRWIIFQSLNIRGDLLISFLSLNTLGQDILGLYVVLNKSLDLEIKFQISRLDV